MTPNKAQPCDHATHADSCAHETPELYGLIGYPLGHSFSQKFFTEKFATEGIHAEYRNFEIQHIDALSGLIAEHPNLRGLNVTIPHKQAVIHLLDTLSDEARAIGAVNVIRVMPPADDNGSRPRLKGFNSDFIGFRDSLKPLLQPHHNHALVLGTGGASKAVIHALDTLGITWQYVSRKPAAGQLTYDDLTPDIMDEYTLIVNCTPLGMSPNVGTCPDIPYECLTHRHLLYDLVYNPEETLFLRRGRESGATTKNGLEMLHRQAVESWKMWHE